MSTPLPKVLFSPYNSGFHAKVTKRVLCASKITQQRSPLETLSAGEESSVKFISIIQRVLGRLIAAGRATPIPAKSPGHPIFQVYILRGIYAPQVGDQSETWTCGLAKPEDGLSLSSIKNLKKQNQRIFIDRALIDRVPDPTLSP